MKVTCPATALSWAALISRMTTAPWELMNPVPDSLMTMPPSAFTSSTTATCPYVPEEPRVPGSNAIASPGLGLPPTL